MGVPAFLAPSDTASHGPPHHVKRRLMLLLLLAVAGIVVIAVVVWFLFLLTEAGMCSRRRVKHPRYETRTLWQ